MLRQFRSDRNFLGRYHEQVGLGLLVVNIALLALKTPTLNSVLWFLPGFWLLSSPQVTTVLAGLVYSIAAALVSSKVTPIHLAGIPLAIILTFPFTALIHGAAHDSLRPRWLNRPIGELMGVVQLFGFPDWKVLHVIHHSHSDDPENDPHAPGDKTFWKFTIGMRASALNAYIKYYLKQFGQTPESSQAILRFGRASKFGTVMKLVFWFLLLGPVNFAFCYVVSIAFKMLHYAWLNYYTHRDGEIRNFNHGLIYPAINAIAFGLYFHKNHHLAPSLLDPRSYLKKEPTTKTSLGSAEVEQEKKAA